MSAEREERNNSLESVIRLAKNDGRYDIRAFQFLFEALKYAQELYGKDSESENEIERHVTGQEMCEGIRRFALEQFGYMAKAVFEGWGIYRTDDFGEIVYLLIQNRLMAKTESDSIEDFHRIYDFHTAFEDVFAPDKSKEGRAKRRPRI